MTEQVQKLEAENQKLKKALAALIPWAGEAPEGPDWATPEAKARNRAMFEKALNDAYKCFPGDDPEQTPENQIISTAQYPPHGTVPNKTTKSSTPISSTHKSVLR